MRELVNVNLFNCANHEFLHCLVFSFHFQNLQKCMHKVTFFVEIEKFII
jgi:hypothetical protein